MQQPPEIDETDPIEATRSVRSVRDVIGLWPSRKALADEVEAAGSGGPEEAVTVERVHKWAKRGVIPATYHGRVLRAAARRGIPLSADDLVAAHDQNPSTATEEDAA